MNLFYVAPDCRLRHDGLPEVKLVQNASLASIVETDLLKPTNDIA